MSGHPKWATTKHKKAAIDAKRGKLFAHLIKNTEAAARTGDGNPAGSPTLHDAIQKAKKDSVPVDNIDRAVKRGSDAEAGGANCETIMCEGYGPGGVAFLAERLTDSRNRAASDVRPGLTRHGGSPADPGSVSYLLSRHGIVEVPTADGVDEGFIMMAVLDAGAEEVEDAGEPFIVEFDPEGVVVVRTALQDAGINYDSAEVQFIASTEVEFDLEGVLKVNKLIDALEDSDDVQNIYTNMSLSDEIRAQLEEQE